MSAETTPLAKRVVRGDADGYVVEVRRAGQWVRQCWHPLQSAAFACKARTDDQCDRHAALKGKVTR